jgi:hypothetical protein
MKTMKRLKIVIIFFLLLFICRLSAQTGIYIIEEDAIRQMMDSRKELNFKKDRNIKAWSIQIMVTRDKYEVVEKKDEFNRSYDEFKVDWSYEQPYYRLNVGAFYTKLEATMVLNKFIEKYPDAYVFKNDQAKPSDF